MNGATAGQDDFPVAHCAHCSAKYAVMHPSMTAAARDVLAHVHLDPRAEARRLCLHCDAEIDPAEVRWVDEAALEPLGYGLHRAEEGGCGRPGCGRGNCGNRR